MHFSKTMMMAGLQCEKHLYLRVHHPELAKSTVSPATVTGEVVQAQARRAYPEGILIERNKPDIDPIIQTQNLLSDPLVAPIFEAAIRNSDLVVFVDVLSREGNGWVLTEVKAATSVKPEHIDDITIQALAIESAGIPVKRYELMHIDNSFVYQGGHDYTGLFKHEDVTEQVLAHRDFIINKLDRFKTLIKAPQPERHIGSYCKQPYPCPYLDYCTAQDAPFPVAWLPNGWRVVEKMHAQGIHDIRDIPVDEIKSETHLRVRNSTVAGKPELLPGAKRILEKLDYPRYYVDFESIQFAIPIWKATKPFQQLPFQWSCHVQSRNGELEHREFLDVTGEDPRRAFALSLIDACGEAGPMIVYNQAFEKMILRQLAEAFPDLSDTLMRLHERVFDLLPVTKQHYYHPDMKGSWSIKSVLPRLVPGLQYSDLGQVQDGTQAQAVYLDLIGGGLSSEEKDSLRADLIEYCKLDTLAMVRIAQRLCERAQN